ncbi:hypothetical protein LP420_18700 [Massilia sp. B-10]|nr:hypothetical protein LP420_18700 [Massilia sp. B-10]
MVALMFMSVPYVLARRARGRAPDQDRGAAARGGRLPGAGHARRALVLPMSCKWLAPNCPSRW